MRASQIDINRADGKARCTDSTSQGICPLRMPLMIRYEQPAQGTNPWRPRVTAPAERLVDSFS